MPEPIPTTPVTIVDTEKPIEVVVKPDETEKKVVNKGEGKTLSPNTTEEEDLVTLGQRTINLIWEHTQSDIAKATVYGGLVVNSIVIITLIILRKEITTAMIAVVLAALGSMNTTTGIIIGFYFSRTNHSAIGGTGKKKQPSDSGTR